MNDSTVKAKGLDRLWASGYGVIRHSPATRRRVRQMVALLSQQRLTGDGLDPYEVLHAADRVASAAMWLVVHETYAQNVYLDGRALASDDFKAHPEGHTGGALNIVPAYAGYLAVNALTGLTRSWVMGQGHTVAGIDSVNLLLDNMTPAHAERYSLTEEGLTRYVRDFYSYRLGADGRQDSPLGSHVNANTAGGLAEGGYLGFTELQYVHMPLPGERLVVFLSDGAFEEQRGSDWAPRWWRVEDSGLVAPIMINNGRRIDQRTTMSQSGGVRWFVRHLRLNGFDPMVFDGRDPSAFAWAVFQIERRLQAAAEEVKTGRARYPVRLPYGIAVAPKGAGFYNEGTNLAHNLPLVGNPRTDATAARDFNVSARKLWVPFPELQAALAKLQRHAASRRPRERDHALAVRDVRLKVVPDLDFRTVPGTRHDPATWTTASAMDAIDLGFLRAVQANPHLRPRVGNPDEMRSNRMLRTLEALKFRVTDPEPGVPEAVNGAVITALNEEAVASAAFANKGGINIIVTYEAFGAKMHGVARQEVIFAAHCKANRPPRLQGWLSVPLVLTSHAWENGKNELSHQDPAMALLMLAEPSDVSRVLFPADYNTAAAVMQRVYTTQGQVWTLVVAKSAAPDLFTRDEATDLVDRGALRLSWAGHNAAKARLALIAVGSIQLGEALKASRRLAQRGVAHSVAYVLEPGRFREPRSELEERHLAPAGAGLSLAPSTAEACVVLTHTRPGTMASVLAPALKRLPAAGLGFINEGGTLDIAGMLWVNHCSWLHCLAAGAGLLGLGRDALLTPEESDALAGRRGPEGVAF